MAELAQHRHNPFVRTPPSAEAQIRELAALHGVMPQRTVLDDWSDAVTTLAGNDVVFDDIQEIIVEMRKRQVMDGIALTQLHKRYLDERG
jgi:hypothetical protein